MSTNFLKKISVKWRLVIFIVMLLIIIVGSGSSGLQGMRKSKDSLSNVYLNNVLPVEELRAINDLFHLDVSMTIEKILYEQISWDQALRIVEPAKIKLQKRWSTLLKIKDKSYSTENEDDWLFKSRPIIAASEAMVAKLITILKGKDIDQLDDFEDQEFTPLALTHEETINYLIHDRVNAIKMQYDHSSEEYKFSTKAFAATVILAVFICVTAGLFMIKTINEPLSEIAKGITLLKQGDFTHKMKYDSEDEFGLVIDGFNHMTQSLLELIAQVQKSGIQVTSSITEIAAVTKEQEASANEHAATTSEIAASTNQIAATSANLLETMKRVNSLTKNTAHAAESGHAGLSTIDNTMMKMENATGSIVTKLSILSEKAGNIAGVVKTINKVADQTNLLSLNAAIEAEKAGEYGAGFAVVATEIRRLADQTAVATFDIEQMVLDVQSAVTSAVMGIDKFADDVRSSVSEIRDSGEELSGIIEQVQVLIPQMTSVGDGIEAQSLGAQQISEATSQLDEAAQHTAESIAQTGNTISQLQQAAYGLQEAISRFKVT